MKRPILPYDTRVKAMEFMDNELTNPDIQNLIRKEAERYVKSEYQLTRCIKSIRMHHTMGHRPRKVDGIF